MKKIVLLTGMAFVCLLLTDAPVIAQSARNTRDFVARTQDNNQGVLQQDRSPVSRRRAPANVPSRRGESPQTGDRETREQSRDRSSDRGTWERDREDRDYPRRESDNRRKWEDRDNRDCGNDRGDRDDRDKKYGGKNKHNHCHHPGKHKGHHKKNHHHCS